MFSLTTNNSTLNLLSLDDGYCLASIHADDLPRLNPPHGYKSADSVSGSWDWVTLSVVPYVEASRILKAAVNHLLTCLSQSVMAIIVARPHPESIPTRLAHSRIVVYKIPEFDPEAVPDPSVCFEKVGEWFIEADARSVSFVSGYSRFPRSSISR